MYKLKLVQSENYIDRIWYFKLISIIYSIVVDRVLFIIIFYLLRNLIVILVEMGDNLGDEWWKLGGNMSGTYYFFTGDVDMIFG